MLAECVHTRVLVQRPDLHHSHRRQCVKGEAGEAGGGMGIRRERASAYLVLLHMHTLAYSHTCTYSCDDILIHMHRHMHIHDLCCVVIGARGEDSFA